jgi:VWFA-related protein
MNFVHLAFYIAAAAAAAFAQEGAAPPRSVPQTVIRTETRLVLVDAVVRDKKGKLAGGLGAGDFRVWEDGKEQPFTSFSREGAGSQDQEETQYLLFLFDNSVSAGKSARQDVADFAGAYASPDRYMAVVNFKGDLSIAQNFTAMAERVQRAAGAVANVTDAAHATGVGRAPVPNSDLSAQLSDASSRYPNTYSTFPGLLPPLQTLPIVEAIRSIADSMAAIRGRKSIVVLGGNQPVHDFGPSLATVAAARDCNRANVAVYATNLALKSLAEETGGRWIPNNLIRELGGVVDDQEKRYVLGFKPVESPAGSCHSLRVQTTRGGLEVRARNAYCNVKAPDLLAGNVAGKALEARAAGPSSGNAAASMELPYFYSSPGIALIDLAMELDLANLKFAKQNAKQHAEVDLVGLAYGTDGEVAGRFSDTVQLDFETAQEADAFRKQPYRYERQFRLPSGRFNVRVAFGSGEQSFGKVEAPLKLDAWDGQRLALSGIALASEAPKVSDLTSDLDPSLLEGHKDLIAKSTEILPSGSNRFRRSAPCFGFLEIYDSLLAGPNPPTFGLAIRILDRQTGAQKEAGTFNAADYIRPGNPVAPVLLKVPIASLSPGSYVLEVKALRSPGNDSVVRTVEFSVE